MRCKAFLETSKKQTKANSEILLDQSRRNK